MKHLPIVVLLLTINLNTAFCPTYPTLYIPSSSAIKVTSPSEIVWEPLIDAIFTFESTRDTTAYNSAEKATGGLQITPVLLEEYNKLTGRNYELAEMYNFEKSKEVFMYYTKHNHGGKRVHKSMEQVACDWNGDRTGKYWKKIQNIMNT